MRTFTKILGIVIGSFAVLSLAIWLTSPQIVKALGNIIRSGSNLEAMRTSSSTTSPAYISTGAKAATSTLTFASEEFESLTLYLQSFASTTNDGANSPILNINRYASDDNINFFPYLNSTTTVLSPSLTYSSNATTTTIIYAPSATGVTTTLAFDLKFLPAKYTRLEFIVSSSTQSTTYTLGYNIWANVVGVMNPR